MRAMTMMPEADAQKVKYHLQEAAKLLKAHTPPEELQDFESIELAAREHIVATVGPVMGEIFFHQGSHKTLGNTAK